LTFALCVVATALVVGYLSPAEGAGGFEAEEKASEREARAELNQEAEASQEKALAASAHVGGNLVPRSGAYFGTTVDGLKPGSQIHLLAPLQRKVHRKFELVQTFYGWKDAFPSYEERMLVSKGQIPVVAWKGTNLSAINSGRFDSMIRKRAREMKRWGHPVFLRWGFEMNGKWEAWSGPRNQPNGPRKYRLAYRRIWRIFKTVGANKVVWVWSINNEDLPRVAWNHWTHYYPGSRYVDWVGVSGFNWGATQSWSSWRSISEIIRAPYRDYHNKPIMIVETGSVEQGGSKAGWIRGARYSVKKNFPAVRAFVYFNATDNQGATWPVTTSLSAVRAYRLMGHDPYWDARH
jgi:hypothetical protein